jgi:DNA polymerase-3 subunit epsilon/ATP-dependent DNA helicase DinG
MPGPNSREYGEKLAAVVLDIARALQGRTLVLFTAHAAIKNAFGKIQKPLKQEGIEVLAQKITGGRRKIIDKFKNNPKAVILGTASFWQGVDLAGDILQAVIIAKLPFDVPSEPVFAARQEEYQNGFTEYALPRAILRLRQGFGRLVRTKNDKGAVVILDNRVREQQYGQDFLESLPDASLQYTNTAAIGSAIADWLGKSKG